MRAYWAKVAKQASKEAGVAVFTSRERAADLAGSRFAEGRLQPEDLHI